MPSPSPEMLVPDTFELVNNPDTGNCDAQLELWNLGDHSPSVAAVVQRIAELNGGVFGPFPKRSGLYLTTQSLLVMCELAPNLPSAPEVSQFYAVGLEQTAALKVSYRDPLATPPSSHPGIDRVVRELIGSQYITLSRRNKNNGSAQP